MKWFDLIIIAALVIWAAVAIIRIVKNKKNGCSCGCSSCPYSGKCGKEDKTK